MRGELPVNKMLGGFSKVDGTIEFYGRINAFLQPQFIVADLGAGRGAWHEFHRVPYHRELRTLKGKVSKVIGLDVDEVVLTNPTTDENIVIREETLPLANESVDVVVADFVLEHLAHPDVLEREVFRVLKRGGLFCARTPHAFHYVSIAARLLRGRVARWCLSKAQPSRRRVDVFDTMYRCNTIRRIRSIWSLKRWTSYTYLYSAEPSYYFGSSVLYRVFNLVHVLLPKSMSSNIFIFEIKR